MSTEKDYDSLIEEYKEKILIKCLPINIVGHKFHLIVFPEVPVNLKMLLTDIEMPEKAKVKDGEGINGSLYNKPIKEMMKRSADMGLTVFTPDIMPSIDILANPNSKSSVHESLYDMYKDMKNNSFIQAIFEGDIDSPGDFLDVEQTPNHTATSDLKSLQKLQNNNSNPVDAADAIDKVVQSSLNGVLPLLRVIGVDTKLQTDLAEYVSNANNAAYKNIDIWLEKEDKVLTRIGIDKIDKMKADLNNLLVVQKYVLLLANDRHEDYKLVPGIDKKEFNSILLKFLDKPKDLDELYLLLEKKLFIVPKSSSGVLHQFISTKTDLFEAEEDNLQSDREILLDFDDIFNKLRSGIATILSPISATDPEQWNIVKIARRLMDEAKKRADDEINAKIEIICRTSNAANSDIGDKLKSALSKHPLRAEGLKSLWKRYSLDLDQRIENRIKQISDTNGNGTPTQFAYQFLTVTYPTIIAVLLTYKVLLYTIGKEYQNYLSHAIPEEELNEMAEEQINNDLTKLMTNLALIKDYEQLEN